MHACIVTTTYYRSVSDLRFQLALKTLSEAEREGLETIVVDGSPDSSIRNELGKYAHVFPQQSKGMGPSRREALRAALGQYPATGGYEAIIWIEPEKWPLVSMLREGLSLIAEREFDFVIPRRDSLESYPPYQELSELRANWELAAITGRPDLDLMFGPRIMTRSVAALLAGYDGSFGDDWEVLFVPLLEALKMGTLAGSYSVAYRHPAEQTAAEKDSPEMNAKRDTQRTRLVSAMRAAARSIGYRAPAHP